MFGSHELGPQQLKYMTVRSDSSAFLNLSLSPPCLAPEPEPEPSRENVMVCFEEAEEENLAEEEVE